MNIMEKIIQSKIVPVIRGNNFEEAKQMIDACIAGGIHIIEMTYTNPDASKIFAHYREAKDIIVGAGSVLNLTLAEKAKADGAMFIVSPNLNLEVASYSKAEEILYIPGCLTPTEIAAASNQGIEFVKIFPGDAVGKNYLKAVRGPMPHMKFMVTGGVDNDNYLDWLASGANCVGLGSSLTKDIDKIEQTAKLLLSKI